MSFYFACIAIEGNYLYKIDTIFDTLGFKNCINTIETSSSIEANEIYRRIYRKDDVSFVFYACTVNGWTIILDTSAWLLGNNNFVKHNLKNVSSILNTKILFISTSDYKDCFYLYNNGEIVRGYAWAPDCPIPEYNEQIGELLPIEHTFTDYRPQIIDDFELILKDVSGVTLEGIDIANKFIVKSYQNNNLWEHWY